MKKTYFHGTSADNLESILKNGLVCDSEKIWSPSEEGVYFWSPDKLVEMGETEEDYKENYAFERAKESAQCALAKAKDCRAVVFEVELDDSEIENDTSCPNMEGAVVIYSNIPLNKIKSIKITNDLSLFKGYFIGLMLNNYLSSIDFNEIETKIGEFFYKSVIDLDIIDEIIKWEEISLTK
jgi:hypothetical protein